MLLQAPVLISPKADAVLEILLVLSLATVLGWLLARLVYAGRVATLRERIGEQQALLDECRRGGTVVLETPIHIESVIPAPIPGVNTFTEPPVIETFVPAESAEGLGAGPDDLKIIEGIGPKIEELLNREGILTFAQLAATDPARLRRLLDAAGPRFQIQDPTTWPQQAQLAVEERWDDLNDLQRRLTAGRT